MKTNRGHYVILLLLAFVFIAPGITAYFFYTHPQWLGATSTNKGVLLNPPVLLPSLNQPITAKQRVLSPGPKWRLILWSPTTCENACLKQLDELARIRLALGRRLYNVVPQLVLGANASPLSEKLTTSLHDQDIQRLQLSSGAADRIGILQDKFKIFIANPDNYLVLAYPPNTKPGDIFHDLKHLLTMTDKGKE